MCVYFCLCIRTDVLRSILRALTNFLSTIAAIAMVLSTCTANCWFCHPSLPTTELSTGDESIFYPCKECTICESDAAQGRNDELHLLWRPFRFTSFPVELELLHSLSRRDRSVCVRVSTSSLFLFPHSNPSPIYLPSLVSHGELSIFFYAYVTPY